MREGLWAGAVQDESQLQEESKEETEEEERNKNTIERKKQEARSKRQKKEGAGASWAGKVKVWSQCLELASSRFRK